MKLSRLTIYWVFALLLIPAVIVSAQDNTCPEIVREALAATDSACSGTGRNQACYGNISLSAEPQDAAQSFNFSQPGDLVNIADVQRLILSPLDQVEAVWGVALMRVQANLPDTLPGQNVTFILFGDVEIENAVTDSTATQDTAMQAFYFKTGLNDAPCEQAPDSGILIQTPEGAGRINLTINNANIELGSTAYLQAQPGGDMTISLVEGEAEVESNGVAVIVPAGTYTTIPLDDDLNAAGEPAPAEPYDADSLAALPLALMPQQIEIAPPLEVIAEATAPVGAGFTITPGNWRYTMGQVGLSAACPAFLASAMQMASQSVIVIIPEGEFSLANVITADGETMPAGAIFSNPEPNLYVMDLNQEGVPLHYEFRFLSAIYAEGQMTIDMNDAAPGCVVTIPSTMEYVG
ncbi:MAG: hypothetical protein JNJ78_21790 [Anaerolineae bacterium]|nr:hypothetical protein [Anaerolineae bacterium]